MNISACVVQLGDHGRPRKTTADNGSHGRLRGATGDGKQTLQKQAEHQTKIQVTCNVLARPPVTGNAPVPQTAINGNIMNDNINIHNNINNNHNTIILTILVMTV